MFDGYQLRGLGIVVFVVFCVKKWNLMFFQEIISLVLLFELITFLHFPLPSPLIDSRHWVACMLFCHFAHTFFGIKELILQGLTI